MSALLDNVLNSVDQNLQGGRPLLTVDHQVAGDVADHRGLGLIDNRAQEVASRHAACALACLNHLLSDTNDIAP